MTASCDQIEELILNSLSGAMTPAEDRTVAEHLAQCAACRKFQDEVAQDDEQLTAYAEAVSRSVGILPERVSAALAKRAVETPGPIPFWRKIMRSRISQISTAAVVAAAVLMVVSTGRQQAWAQITEALQKAQRFHLVAVYTGPDGKTERDELWFEKPNRLREETPASLTVDDGVNRVFLDRTKRTAQPSDSQLPSEFYDVFSYIEIIRLIKEHDPKVSIKLTPLPDEKGGAVQVYAVEIDARGEKLTAKGKLWTATDTKLPIRGECEIRIETEKNPAHVPLELTWSYDPIPAELFSIVVPAGYTELPRQRRGALKGRVLDEQGAPVAEALVYAAASHFENALEGRSDTQGNFEIKLPPENSRQTPTYFRVFVAAFRRDDPDSVAWTMITDPNDKSEQSRWTGPIPGDPGRCGVLDGKASPQYGVSGIVLKMEPAGRIHGMVAGMDGAPVRGAEIFVAPGYETVNNYGSKQMHSWPIYPRGPSSTKTALAVTDAQGRYELTNVPRLWDRVTFYMFVEAEGYYSKSASFTTNGPMVSQEMNFRLYKTGFTVTGRAVSDHGEPLVGYEVVPVVEGHAGFLPRERRITTGADGRFTLPDCPATPELRIRLWADHPTGWRWEKPSKPFYPQVEAGIKYETGKMNYEVNFVAETPAITLRIVLKDSAGMPVPYFPVELRHGCLTELWSRCRLCMRTDANGVCVLTGVPLSEGMTLYLSSDNDVPPESVSALTPEQKKVAAGNGKFKSVEPPVKLAPDRNEQTIEVILLTQEEWKARKPAPK